MHKALEEGKMFSESKFSDLTESLASGFFADKVIFALARFQKTKELNSQELSVLQQVVEFFKKVIVGHNWLDNPQLSRNSVESASYFSQVVRAMSPSVSSENFVTYIRELQDTAEKLAAQRTVDDAQVENLRKFFSKYGLSELVRTENLLQDDRLEIFG
jgi:hypothetical protein